MIFSAVIHTYRLALPDESQAQAEQVIAAAVDRARVKHPDFERFLPAMERLSFSLFTDHRTMPIDDYFECLYCTVKHGDFTKAWRGLLKGSGKPN